VNGTLVRDPYPYAVGCRDYSDQDAGKDRFSAVHGNSSLHGLSEHKVHQDLRAEERTHILQQLEDDVPEQRISDALVRVKLKLTLDVPEYKQIVRRRGLR
jgi:hypothetical protein